MHHPKTTTTTISNEKYRYENLVTSGYSNLENRARRSMSECIIQSYQVPSEVRNNFQKPNVRGYVPCRSEKKPSVGMTPRISTELMDGCDGCETDNTVGGGVCWSYYGFALRFFPRRHYNKILEYILVNEQKW